MKIFLAKFEPDRTGGGWVWQRNFIKGAQIYRYEEADVYLISGSSMVDKEEVRRAKSDGKKIVLRADNMPRNSRNRNSGSSRLKLFAELADLVIYQSKWARNFLFPFLQIDGPVILNGVDTDRFNPHNRTADEETYLYCRSSRDEGKQWIMAWYWFVNNPGLLEIVGKFSDENFDYNFDFFNKERYRFIGTQEHMEDVYSRNKYFLYTYLNDACSNTLLEARASGMEILDIYGMLKTGGAPEIMALEDLSSERMTQEYLNEIKRL